ncbi:hypothetical protein MTR_8g012005 [Medicago truncatula]|uniref:TIR-NBS-LRR RCT1-like resistance protein n=1 Tax=Medicago truncatula TaxID=3880 RepID=A0A072TKZ6_MEDTR|nr:hypothetical protein MTR_8g012005 [Medicago truncatula]
MSRDTYLANEGLTTNDYSGFCLPGGNYPSWLAYTGEGPSVLFQVPKDIDCHMKGIVLCVVYSSTSENVAVECLTNVLIINYTKCTIQIYKGDTVMSFNDEDWKGLTLNLGPGDNVEIFVVFGHGLIVKETSVYLIYGQSTTKEFEQSFIMEVEPSTNMKLEPWAEVSMPPSPEVNLQLSPNVEVEASITVEVDSSTNMEMEPLAEVNAQLSPEVDMQPSSNVKVESSTDVKTNRPSQEVKVWSSPIMVMEPQPKSNRSIFTGFAKRMGTCLCLNQHRDKGLNNV